MGWPGSYNYAKAIGRLALTQCLLALITIGNCEDRTDNLMAEAMSSKKDTTPMIESMFKVIFSYQVQSL